MPSSSGGQRSDISCHACRKRKVKCGRTSPHCIVVCQQTENKCTYPPGPLKPGPKIGSLRPRKRPPTWSTTAIAVRREGQGASALLAGASAQNVSTTAEAKALDLSFILRPSHVSSPPNKEGTCSPMDSTGSVLTPQPAMQRAHALLGVTSEEAEQLTTTYFDKVMSINLFHQPSFSEKLARITSSTQVAALLAAMLAFAMRFRPDEADANQRATRFLDLALKQVEEGLDEAWRTLGTCVRLAYGMNLHLMDVQGPKQAAAAANVNKSCNNVEQPHAWWAIWGMDAFATTIQPTPTAMDWSQIEILLPVDDKHWFQRKPQESCFFEPDPIRQWKVLENCGIQSPRAWSIIINSLMKEAQRTSSPRGIPIRCFQLELPGHLKYNHQYSKFDVRGPGWANSAISNIHMTTHLARLMVYRYDVFKDRVRVSLPSHDHDSSPHSTREAEHSAVKELFDAADNILAIIHRSSDQSEVWAGADMMNASMPDPMALQPVDLQPVPSQFLSSATLVDPMFLLGANTPPMDFFLIVGNRPSL
ncbi:hypothetical protein BDW68DRAFT_182652 [Aspergillus falconensis]